MSRTLGCGLLILLTPAARPSAPATAETQFPFGNVTATFAAGEAETAWLPIALHRDRYIYVSGRLNGVETDLVVDSGAGATVIDESLARQLDLKLEGGVRATGVGGTVPAKLTRSVRLELAGLTLSLPAAVVIDLAGVRGQMGRAMPVIVGRDVFAVVAVDIDYALSRMALRRPNTWQPSGEFHEVPLHDSSGRYQVEGQIDQLPPARFELDTGSSDMLIVFKPYADAQKLLESRTLLSTRQIGGVGGSSIARLGTTGRYRLGDERLVNVPTVFPQNQTGAFATDRVAGLIGAGLLRRFRVIFDASQHRLFLAATTDPGAPFPKDRLGLQVVADADGLRVVHVALGSPAAKAGWQVSNRITAVNGTSVPADFWSSWRDATTAPAGGTIRLRDGRGRESTLVLADYY